jgi:Rieske Fe-S protein
MRKLHVLTGEESPCLSRRRALATFAAGAVSAVSACSSDSTKQQTGTDGGGGGGGVTDSGGAMDAGTSAASCSPPVGTNEGAVTGYPVGTWKMVGDVVIGQDAMGVFALTAYCSHAGCMLNPPAKDGTMSCPCHGAEFDGNGAVLMGPAMRPLQHFAVSVCNGTVYVDKKTNVPADTRTPAT